MTNILFLIIIWVLFFMLVEKWTKLNKSIEECCELVDVIVDLKEDICILEDRVFDLEEEGGIFNGN